MTTTATIEDPYEAALNSEWTALRRLAYAVYHYDQLGEITELDTRPLEDGMERLKGAFIEAHWHKRLILQK